MLPSWMIEQIERERAQRQDLETRERAERPSLVVDEVPPERERSLPESGEAVPRATVTVIDIL